MGLIEPHGGALRVLYLPSDEAADFRPEAAEYPAWNLTQRQLCDLKLLLNGGFSPLSGFLGEDDYDRVLESMRLADGTLWPIPVTLDVSSKFADGLRPGQRIGLRDPEGFLIAAMTVESIWQPDRRGEAEAVFGTTDEAHAGVDYLLNQSTRGRRSRGNRGSTSRGPAGCRTRRGWRSAHRSAAARRRR
jgi:sulfate adenylyltransferase